MHHVFSFLTFVIDKVVCYFNIFIYTCNVFDVAYRSDGPGVKFTLIIVDIPCQIVYTCLYK